MKYHLTRDGVKSICGVLITPEKFAFDEKGFYGHYAPEYRCSKCLNINHKPLILTKVK